MVVLLDHLMPKLAGGDLLRLVASDPELRPRHAFVVVTASAQVALLEQQIAAADGMLVPVVRKPSDIEALLNVVGEATTRLAD